MNGTNVLRDTNTPRQRDTPPPPGLRDTNTPRQRDTTPGLRDANSLRQRDTTPVLRDNNQRDTTTTPVLRDTNGLAQRETTPLLPDNFPVLRDNNISGMHAKNAQIVLQANFLILDLRAGFFLI